MPYYYDTQIGFGGKLTRTVKNIILLNCIVFVSKYLLSSDVYTYLVQTFALTPGLCLNKLMLWQPFTSLFIHAGVWDLLINMFVLWMFGADVEEELGSKNFLVYYLFAGLGGGIAYLFLSQSSIPMFGSAPSILGILLAFGFLFPDRVITLLLLLIFPVRIRAKYLAALFIGIELFMALEGGAGNTEKFAALGGIVFGYLFLKKRSFFETIVMRYFRLPGKQLKTYKIIRPNFKTKVTRTNIQPIKGKSMKKVLDKEGFIAQEIDPILDKISKKGIDSLSKEEKEKLEKAKHLIK